MEILFEFSNGLFRNPARQFRAMFDFVEPPFLHEHSFKATMSDSQNDSETNPNLVAEQQSSKKSGSWFRTLVMLFTLGIVLLLGGVIALWAMGGTEMEFVATQKIKASSQDVFQTLTDPDLVIKWVTGVTKIEDVGTVKDGRVGAKARVTIEIDGTTIVVDDEVTKYQKNREVELEMISESFDSKNRFLLTPNFERKEDGDVTEVAQTYRVKFSGLTRVFAPFMKGAIEKQIKSDLKRLKQLVETGKIDNEDSATAENE